MRSYIYHRLFFAFALCAFCLVGPVSASVVFDQDIQWYSTIKTHVVYDLSGDTVSWSISHVQTYNSTGAFQVTVNGSAVATYGGGGTNPYASPQSGSATLLPGQTIVAITGAFSYTRPDATQVVSLYPGGGASAILTGQTFHGIATGAQAGNSYNISIVSGGGGASINASTGDFTVTAGPTGGLIHYKVWISAGGGYARSADVESNIAVSLSKKVTVTIPANTGSYTITYTLKQGGVVIGTYVQVPGHGNYIMQVDVGANDGPVTLLATTTGVTTDGVSYIDDPLREVTQVISETILPTTSTTPVSVPPPSTNNAQAPAPAASGGTVWSSGNGSADPAAQKDLLTNQVFREGIDKLFVNDQNMTPGDTLDTSDVETQHGVLTADKVTGIVNKLPGRPTFEAVGSASPVLAITLPLITGVSGGSGGLSFTNEDYVFSFNFTDWVTRLAWLRELIRVILMVWLFVAITRQVRESVAN